MVKCDLPAKSICYDVVSNTSLNYLCLPCAHKFMRFEFRFDTYKYLTINAKTCKQLCFTNVFIQHNRDKFCSKCHTRHYGMLQKTRENEEIFYLNIFFNIPKTIFNFTGRIQNA